MSGKKSNLSGKNQGNVREFQKARSVATMFQNRLDLQSFVTETEAAGLWLCMLIISKHHMEYVFLHTCHESYSALLGNIIDFRLFDGISKVLVIDLDNNERQTL